MGTTLLKFNDWNLKKRNTISWQYVQQRNPLFHSFRGFELSMILRIFDGYYGKWHVVRHEPSRNFGVFIVSDQYVLHTFIHASMDPCISSLAQGTSKASRVLSIVSAARRPIVRTRVSERLIDGGLSLSNKMTGVSEKSLTSKVLESLDALHVSMNIFWGGSC